MPEATPETLELEQTVGQELDASQALSVVLETFNRYDSDRKAHEHRWDVHDQLYLGVTQKRYWPNSTIERASLPYPVVFEHIDAALPIILGAIFTGPQGWFQVLPQAGASPQEAQDLENALRFILEEPIPEEQYEDARAEITLAIRSTLLYGNGFLHLEWSRRANRPIVRWIDHRDVYVDPAARKPSIDSCRSVILRFLVPIRELEKLRGTPGMDIPPLEVLEQLSGTGAATADQAISLIESSRKGGPSGRNIEDSPIPEEKPVELLIYYSPDRVIWILGRAWVAYNEKNPYGFIPVVSAPCYPVTRRFYAQSIADVQEPAERAIEEVLNRHLDELNLKINPPKVVNWAAQVGGQNAMRWFPGQTIQARPEDIRPLYDSAPVPVIQTLEWLRVASERITGINALTLGTPLQSNMARTLGATRLLESATTSRLSNIAMNIELYLLGPMLYKLAEMLRHHTQDLTSFLGKTRDGKYVHVNPMSFHNTFRYSIRVASRVMTRDRLMGVIPFLFQTMINGPVMAELAKSGLTLDFVELVRMIQDATGVGESYNLIRPMSQEEAQARTQPPQPSPDELISAQVRLQLGQMKAEAEKYKADIQATKSKTPEELIRENLELRRRLETMARILQEFQGLQGAPGPQQE